MLKLSKTIAAKAWLVPGPADYTASCDSDCARPALPAGEHPNIPSLHHLLLGWHKHFSSCMTCILPTKKQQTGPSLSKQLLPVATLVQEFPCGPKKSTVPIPLLQQTGQTAETMPQINLSVWQNVFPPHLVPVSVICCDYMKISFSSRLGSFQERKVTT